MMKRVIDSLVISTENNAEFRDVREEVLETNQRSYHPEFLVIMRTILRAIVTVIVIAMTGTLTAWADGRDGRLDIYWIDVEGGAATLIVTPRQETLLIDSGNPGIRDPDRIVQVVTKVVGARHIDHLITTHYHRDHFGGAEPLSRLLPIRVVHDNGLFENMPDDPGRGYLEFKTERREVVRPGSTLELAGAADKNSLPLRVTFLAARQQFMEAPADAPANDTLCATARSKDRDGSDNANSVVMRFDFGAFRFFDAGDLTWNQETKLVCPVNLVGTVDVYQVTHHGLDASNNPVVLASLQPRVAIMNNGHEKGCLPEVFANLQATSSLEAIYQVHKNLRPDGSVNNVSDEYIANHTASDTCQGNYIRLSVAADGQTYTVSIPASGHERTFQVVEK